MELTNYRLAMDSLYLLELIIGVQHPQWFHCINNAEV